MRVVGAVVLAVYSTGVSPRWREPCPGCGADRVKEIVPVTPTAGEV